MNSPVRSRKFVIVEAIKIAIVILLVIGFVYFLSPRVKILVNRPLWNLLKPTSYTMQVRERRSDGVMWLWEIEVENNETVDISVLERSRPEVLDSILDFDYSVDQLYEVADICKDRRFVDCGVRFDVRYHFPKYIESYELYIIEVETFIPDAN